MRLTSLLALGFSLFAVAAQAGSIPTNCVDNQECLIEVAGATCADGTPSFMTLTKRPGAQNLLVYFTGGGACWNRQTCQEGLAKPLTRVETPTDWNNGPGIQNAQDSDNPFAKDYNIVTVPYCTGDVYAGDRDADYGTPGNPYVIQHRGYRSTTKILEEVKRRFPTPQKAVLVGCSAGAIGAFYHLRNFAQAFSSSQRYVISDAGTPFEPPYVKEGNFQSIEKGWGADTTLPPGPDGQSLTNLAQLVGYNTRQFPDVHFGLISSYQDKVMTFFALSVGSPSPTTAVRNIIIDTADNEIGRQTGNAKVFFTDGSMHCHTVQAVGSITSVGTTLADWLHGALDESHSTWDNVRPDLGN